MDFEKIESEWLVLVNSFGDKVVLETRENQNAVYLHDIIQKIHEAYQQGRDEERERCEEIINGYMVESVESMELKEKTDVLEFFNQHLKEIVAKIRGNK